MIRGEWVIEYAKPHSRECALPMKKSWLRHWHNPAVVYILTSENTTYFVAEKETIDQYFKPFLENLRNRTMCISIISSRTYEDVISIHQYFITNLGEVE